MIMSKSAHIAKCTNDYLMMLKSHLNQSMMDIRLKVGLFGALKLGLAMLKLSVAILTNAMLTLVLHRLTLVC